jgi:hypothetical protein
MTDDRDRNRAGNSRQHEDGGWNDGGWNDSAGDPPGNAGAERKVAAAHC